MQKYNLPNNFLKLISEHLPDMLWAKDIDGKYLFANKQICKNLLMAENSEEVIGQTDVFFALRERAKHPGNSQWHTFGELCHNSDDVVLDKMEPMRFEEYGNIRGKLVYFDVHKAPFYDEDGSLIGVIGSGRDITDQKRLESKLLESKKEADTIFEKNAAGIFIVDRNRNIVNVNERFCEMFGYTKEEIIGKSTLELHISEENYNSYNAHFLDAKNALKVELEHEYKKKDGSIFWCENHGSQMEFEEDEPGVIWSILDITDRKESELELKTTKQLIESGPVVVFEWSGKEGWPIKFVSSNVESVLGLNYLNLLDGTHTFSEYIYPDDLEKVIQEVTEYTSSLRTSFTQEYRLVREDASVVWIQDFSVIDYNEDNTINTIKGYIFDDTTQKLADERIEHLNSYDQLTNLPNRYKLQLDIDKNNSYACAIFNISSFGEINDFFGVSTGDSILIQLANEMKHIGIDAYRIGGDEFAVLFHASTTRLRLEEWLKSKLMSLQEVSLAVAEETVTINLNVGMAFDTDDLLTKADIALHKAKEKKLSYAIYEKNENIEEVYKKNIEMASTIHQTLAEDRLRCYYQPIVSLQTNKIAKYESLVRMLCRDGKIVPPIDFLSVAKKTKLYPRITRTVIYNACKLFANKDTDFSVNLSIDDINNPVTVQEIIKTIIDTKTADRIIFEILETEGIEEYDSVIRFITQVKALGAKIAIDDFGSGYSSFEHIVELNIDYIKIDGSLIKGISSNNKHRIVVETIVEFAKKMGAKTIAEFVCDEAVYDVVKALGVDYSQGYYTGKPEPLT